MSDIYKPNPEIPLSILPFLVDDNYGVDEDMGDISVTSLMKSTRQIVLGYRVPIVETAIDPGTLVASRRGTAVHDAIEKSWLKVHKLKDKLVQCGISKRVIDAIIINPEPTEDLTDKIPVYVEQRVIKEINGIKVSGKYDLVIDGYMTDIKNTTVWTYMTGRKDDDYKIQGSLYRWLNPEKVTEEQVKITLLFTDWSAKESKFTEGYPKYSVKEVLYDLMSYQETENYVNDKLNAIRLNYELPDDQIPLCTDKELWRTEPSWKFYGKADALRATKVFDDEASARRHQAEKGTGIVKEFKGKVRACNYCKAAPICMQRVSLIQDGSLEV
jgi:hypothetical protein